MEHQATQKITEQYIYVLETHQKASETINKYIFSL